MAIRVYEARRRRAEWPASVRLDPEIKAVDEENGEWILCRTCAEHYDRTRRGRKPNDPDGFKVKMNGKFQEAAWVMHKSRVVSHRVGAEEQPRAADFHLGGRTRKDPDGGGRQSAAKRQKTADSSGEEGGGDGLENEQVGDGSQLVHLPTTGWRCPGIVPDAFYHEHLELIHAFAKYYVGPYRVNVVRDLRSDKVMLFSHDCENQIIHRQLPSQHDCCEKCYDIWLNNKSFKRILKKMDRYALVEDILRRSWSISADELSVLSNFKHSSDMNLNIEGRRLKQAAMTAVQHFSDSMKTLPMRTGTGRTAAGRHERLERAQQPLSMEVMLQLQSFDPSIHDGVTNTGVPESLQHHDGDLPASPNEYLVEQNAPVVQADERVHTENTVTTAARSNNLKKFLRSYASNLDVAISAERSVIMVAESDDSSGDEIVLTLPMAMTKTKAQTVVANPNRGMKFELDLPMLQLESERSNQCDSSPTADDASDVADLVEGTDYEQQSVDNGDDEEGNNDDNNDSRIITSARTNKQAGPETTAQDQDSKPERSAPASKLNLARFQQQVPANGKRLHALRL
ncbi:hypothetical protein PHYBOEH_004756 [Phytophthora boehmeriae]|uniref:Uncharacterized protein n=1 Tax=Phytophthora boehmeriae TaxID=109152 RepID=A0A8T1XAC4_9STRA|nr:hypothetical protein PHYBOEH_004756 [Phytophthora boehmeriae]